MGNTIIKNSAIWGEYIIEIDKSQHVAVYRIYDNVMGSIREIYKKEGLEINPNWNQRQAGYNLIKKFCSDEDKTKAIIGEYVIMRRENGSIETYREYGKGNVKGSLKEIAQKVGLNVDPNWNTQMLGRKLVNFINEIKENISDGHITKEKDSDNLTNFNDYVELEGLSESTVAFFREICIGSLTDIEEYPDGIFCEDYIAKNKGCTFRLRRLNDYTIGVAKDFLYSLSDYKVLVVAENIKGENQGTTIIDFDDDENDIEEIINAVSNLKHDGYTENVQIFFYDGPMYVNPDDYIDGYDMSPERDAFDLLPKVNNGECLGVHTVDPLQFGYGAWEGLTFNFDYNDEIIASITLS